MDPKKKKATNNFITFPKFVYHIIKKKKKN